LIPTQSIIYYILDRNQPQTGVLLWRVSGTADSEIAAQSVNRRKGSVLNIVDPERGYDLEFLRAGQKLATRYRGYQIVREDSPMTDDNKAFDEVLDFIFDNPLPGCLNFYKPEHIEEVYSGKIADDDKDGRDRDEDVQRAGLRGGRSRDGGDQDREAPRMRSRAAPPPDDDDDDTPPQAEETAPPRRSRLAREIDDEIPEQPRQPRRAGRVQVDDDADDGDEGPPFDATAVVHRRRENNDDDGEVDARRARMRDRLGRRD
jgi:hypothetical protein